MSDQPVDPLEARLAEQLGSRAAEMPIRDDGLTVIQRGVRRRHRNRVVAWSTGALVLVLAVIGGAALGTRTEKGAPYVDTTGTTSTVDPNVPSTVPAEPVPAIAPGDGSGYDWQVAYWAGPSAYALSVRERGVSSGTLVLRVQRTPWETASTETTTGPDGQVITIDRSASSDALSWEISPGVTAWVGAARLAGSAVDPVEKSLEMIAALDTVDPARWRGAVGAFFDSSGVLIDDPQSSALGAATDRSAQRRSVDTMLNIWAPTIGWGQLTLEETGRRTIQPEGEPIAVRGVQGTLIDYVATSEGGRMRTLQWNENERTYGLVFGADISLEQAVAVANRLRPIHEDEVDQLLFPTWQPAEMPDMRLLSADQGAPAGS